MAKPSTSCLDKCKKSGFCCEGLVSSHANPSCAMGCQLFQGDAEGCSRKCRQVLESGCISVHGGKEFRLCQTCRGDCDASVKLQCEVGCRYAAGATVPPSPVPTPFPTHSSSWLLEHPPQHVRCKTTKGEIGIDVHPEWSPLGAEHFLELVRAGHFDDVGLLRVNGVIVQFGEQKLSRLGPVSKRILRDDEKPRHQVENRLALRRGELSYAGGGPNTRGGSIFFVTRPNKYLGRAPWELPFAEVVPPGMDVVDSFYAGYGDTLRGCSGCNGPNVQRVFREGTAYLKKEFPLLDFMISCEVVATTSAPVTSTGDSSVMLAESASADAAAEGVGETAAQLIMTAEKPSVHGTPWLSAVILLFWVSVGLSYLVVTYRRCRYGRPRRNMR
eukprot:TRINITY_DN2997_c0_g1_i2.p1 TRINITY_DN2997_c0_g1~~TRINITY_DN2997_c0_g1_i2.p1  ORF type:complete len:386 (+),score=46.22 TRINITY_DN2997_c0_g1_i2:92-1249(+)